MRLIGLNVLQEFCEKHSDCKSWIENWIADVKAAKWTSLNDLKARYPSASILPQNVVIFNVKGNSYRLSVQVAVNVQIVAVKWIGTHSEYSRKNF
ncbi:MAG: type II toxin-antitoxin system HigB family toxin [Nitrososphaerales archaeon]